MRVKKIFLFDLDGVLIDSKKNMEYSWKVVTKKYGIKISFNKYFENIGLPFIQILKKIKVDPIYFARFEKEYRFNSIKYLKHIKLYADVLHTLIELKKKKKIIGILTSKERVRTIRILKNLNIKVDVVMCPYKNYIGKPNPKQINEFLKKKKLLKSDLVYVGDMLVDKITARNANVDYIHANYGYSSNLKNKYFINNISEILKKNYGIF